MTVITYSLLPHYYELVTDRPEQPLKADTPTPSLETEKTVETTEAASVEMVEGLPVALLRKYVEVALRHGQCRQLDSGEWFASVVFLEGAYGEGATHEQAWDSLGQAITDWVVVKRRIGAEVPMIDGLDLNLKSDG